MNEEYSKTSKPHILTLKFTDKLLSNLSIYYTWNNLES